MNTSILPDTIAYAAAVRAELVDLPADEVEDLTDGLEADLAEAWADSDGKPLVDPQEYAQELRTAAGLPPARPRGSTLNQWYGRGRAKVESWGSAIRRNPAGASVLDFLVSLQPAWWVARGLAAYWLIALVFNGYATLVPTEIIALLFAVFMIIGSIWVGKRNWGPAMKLLILAGNVFAVFVLILALDYVKDTNRAYVDTVEREVPTYGLARNGEVITNIFAYDENGALIPQVQLFDQDGNPITASDPGGNGCLSWVVDPATADFNEGCPTAGVWLPSTLETGAFVWNIFPMKMAESEYEGDSEPIPGAEPVDAAPPFVKVPAIGGSDKSESAKSGDKSDKGEASKDEPKETQKP